MKIDGKPPNFKLPAVERALCQLTGRRARFYVS
jgi:hypothetical protein